MEIDQILKQATAYKKSDGYSFALDFLIGCYNECKPEDLSRLFDKIYIYFSKDLNNQNVRNFISELVDSKKIDKYSGYLSDYYWMLKDYESYKLTLIKQISELDPNNPWQYCFDLKNLKLSLCNYFQVMGLHQKQNASEYLYNIISSTYFDFASELMMFDSNFNKYYSYKRFGHEPEFYHPDRLIPILESVEGWFDDDSDNDSICLNTLNGLDQREDIVELVKQKIFIEFPKLLGFKIDILNENENDCSSFAFSFFNKEDFEDILQLTDKINDWRIKIVNKANEIVNEETNSILAIINNK